MRYLKIASINNSNDFIELNDLNGFFCTRFEAIGLKRQIDHFAIKNRQISVDNKVEFKKYNLVIEILSKYSEYEVMHEAFMNFLDRNKMTGFLLYYRPYDNMELRYIICDAIESTRSEKMQPVVLTLQQNSLWLGELKTESTAQNTQELGNTFEYKRHYV